MPYLLPEGDVSEDQLACMRVWYPDRPEYRRALLGSLGFLATWVAWERDKDKRARIAASSWRVALLKTLQDLADGKSCDCEEKTIFDVFCEGDMADQCVTINIYCTDPSQIGGNGGGTGGGTGGTGGTGGVPGGDTIPTGYVARAVPAENWTLVVSQDEPGLNQDHPADYETEGYMHAIWGEVANADGGGCAVTSLASFPALVGGIVGAIVEIITCTPDSPGAVVAGLATNAQVLGLDMRNRYKIGYANGASDPSLLAWMQENCDAVWSATPGNTASFTRADSWPGFPMNISMAWNVWYVTRQL